VGFPQRHLQEAPPERDSDAATGIPIRIRILEIDGIRGWAALSVLFYHFFATCLKHRIPFFAGPWLRAWMDGPLAVLVFFLLSGDALATAFLASSPKSRMRLILGRWPRLVFPIAASSAIVFFLMVAGWTFHGPASKVLGLEDWLGTFLAFRPGLPGLARYSLVDVFRRLDLDSAYNPFLWSMVTELKGSFLVFFDLLVFRGLSLRWHLALLASAAIGFAGFGDGSYLCLFPVGVAIGLCRADGTLDAWRNTRAARWSGWLLPASVVLWVTFGKEPLDTFRGVVAAPVLVFGIYSNRTLLGFFRSGISKFLGRISFPLYVLQFPVLISLASFLYVRAASGTGPRPAAAMSISVLSCVVTILLAWGFSFLDEAYQRNLRRILEGKWWR
jgi:peptidoglycan/LPS O-acetylase OafA/YrhL